MYMNKIDATKHNGKRVESRFVLYFFMKRGTFQEMKIVFKFFCCCNFASYTIPCVAFGEKMPWKTVEKKAH